MRDVRAKDHLKNPRIAIKIIVSTMRFELAMLAVVLVYSMLVFAQLAIDDPEVSVLIDGRALEEFHKVFLVVDRPFNLPVGERSPYFKARRCD